MKYILLIILSAFAIAAYDDLTTIYKKHQPNFRYNVKLIDNNSYSKEQCWEIVKDKFNLKIKDGKLEF
jgi:hypothetical protein